MLSIREVQQTVKKIISNQQIEILSNLGDINKLNLSYNLKKGSKVEVLIADLSKNHIQLGTIIMISFYLLILLARCLMKCRLLI